MEIVVLDIVDIDDDDDDDEGNDDNENDKDDKDDDILNQAVVIGRDNELACKMEIPMEAS